MNLKKMLVGLIALICFSLPIFAEIQAGKAIQITISGVPSEEKGRIDGIYPVSDAGYINMPFIDAVLAAGKRNEDLAASLQARYRSAGIYTNPTIQVISNRGDSIDEQTVYSVAKSEQPDPRHSLRG